MRAFQPSHSGAIALGLLSLLGLGDLRAADFHPIAEIDTNMTTGNPANNPLSNIIEGPGAGFSADEPHDGPSATWYTDAPGGFPSDYVEVHEGPEYLWFDLGMDVALSEISYWGYSTGNANGVREFNVSFATDTEGGGAGLGDEEYGTTITANPEFEAAIDTVPRQSFEFTPVVARYVRVEVTSTHFSNGGQGPPAGGDRVGVGEIAFEKSVTDPDPQISVPAEIPLELTTSVDVFDIPVSNVGGSELTISSTNLTGPNAAAFSVPSFPATIPSLDSDVIELQFDPAGLVGGVSATLQITSNDPDTPTAEILLTGTVPPTEQDIVVPDPVDRGQLAGPDTFDLEVRNGGGSELTINGTSFTGPNAAAFSVLNAPGSIPALGSESFEIQIDPSGLDGPISATLQIESDDPDTPTAEVLISAISLGDAAQFYPIASVQASTAGNDLWPASNLIQGPGEGFNAARPHDQIIVGGAQSLWVTTACGFPCDYIATTGMPVLTFDLGQNVSLCEISVWGYSATNSNGVSEFSLRFATESDGPDGFGSSITFNPTFGGIDSGLLPNEDNSSRFSFLFGQEIFARYVEFTCVDNHFIAPGNGAGGEIPGGDRVGLGEVAFEITSCETPSFFFDVQDGEGDNLLLTWESQNGQLFNVRSETDPSNGEPVTWPIHDGHADIAATPPLNTLTIPRPLDPFRLFVVEAFPAPPVEVFSDDLESGQGEWTVGSDGDAGTAWELGTPSLGPTAANSPANCFGTNLDSEYAINANVWLRSPTIDLTNATGATMSYFEFRDIEEGFDFGTVSLLDAADDSVLAVIEDTIDGVTAGWEQVRTSIPAEGLGKMIKIEWRLTSDDLQNFAGWFLDDLTVTIP